MAELQRDAVREDDDAAEHELSAIAFAIYRAVEGQPDAPVPGETVRERMPFRTHLYGEIRDAALAVESVVRQYGTVVDWQSNLEVQREMRRDIKRVGGVQSLP